MADWLTPPVVGLLGAACGAVTTALATIVVQRRPAQVTAEAAAQRELNDGFAKLMAETMAQLREARGEIQMLRGELVNVMQHMDSLERLLRDAGVDIPVRQRPHVLTVVPATGKPS